LPSLVCGPSGVKNPFVFGPISARLNRLRKKAFFSERIQQGLNRQRKNSDIEAGMMKNGPQGLKPTSIYCIYGETEVVP
jgi:hypothetical protein